MHTFYRTLGHFRDMFVATTLGIFNEASVHFSSLCLATNCIILKKTSEDFKVVLVTATPSIFNRMLVHFPAVLMRCLNISSRLRGNKTGYCGRNIGTFVRHVFSDNTNHL